MITSTVLAALMSVFGAGGCATQGQYAPYVIYYAPYPIWYPKYIGPAPYSDYLVVQYVTPPAETAVIVKQRILAVNAANPVLLPAPEKLPAPREPLSPPRPTDLPPPQK